MNLKPSKHTRALKSYKDDHVMNIHGLRKQNIIVVLIWIFYYAWVVVFTTWWSACPKSVVFFASEIRILIHSITLISSGIFVFIIRKERFVQGARIGTVLTLAGIILYWIGPNAVMQMSGVILIGISLGCVTISILLSFVFALNNTEKLYAIVGSNILVNIVLLLQEGNHGQALFFFLVMIIMVLGGTLIIKKDIISSDEKELSFNPLEFHSRIYLTLAFNIVLVILCRGVGKAILNIAADGSSEPVFLWYYIGGLVGCAIFIASYAFFSKAFVWLGNITFSSLAMGLLLHAFTDKFPVMAVGFAILLGIGTAVGMINMYYIVGIVSKKYNSIHYLKLSILIIGILGGILGMTLGNIIQRTNTVEISIIVSIISVALMLLFLMLSPLVYQADYFEDWAKDSGKTEIDNEQFYIFKQYRLSKREVQVCKLLLQGYTMRQISGILSIAYSTVNTYCTSCYRKIGINSRTELQLIFKDYIIR